MRVTVGTIVETLAAVVELAGIVDRRERVAG
jgi:hypothetical protein